MGEFEGKVAVVTGASTGIGEATAVAFAGQGAKVVLADIDEEGGHKVVSSIRAGGGDALFVRTDVSRADDVEALIKETVRTYGRLDCACNNAGIQGDEAPTAEWTEENWDRVVNVNLKGVWLCVKYEILEMLKTGGGSIVNMSSVNAYTAWPNLAPYVASKHGINGLTKSAAREYAAKGIKINAVAPGIIRTPMNVERLTDPEAEARLVAMEPIGRLGAPEEVAAAVLWLCGEASSFVTGHCLVVDGGYLIP